MLKKTVRKSFLAKYNVPWVVRSPRHRGHTETVPTVITLPHAPKPWTLPRLRKRDEEGPEKKYVLVVNDCLLKVDDEDVYHQSIDRVIKHILGVQNSTISLTLQRFSGDRVAKFATSLKRGKTGTITKTVESQKKKEMREPGSP